MNTPRLDINLDKIFHNASVLVKRLKEDGISVTGVTKAFLGAPQIARIMLKAGVTSLGDSRISNIERMRHAGILARMVLIRSPMISQVDRVVASADMSVNTELDVLCALSAAALRIGKVHDVLLMVELGDLREGIMPSDISDFVQQVALLPNIKLMGLGTNLACRNGISPDNENMTKLSAAVRQLYAANSVNATIVSGGNSSNLNWIFDGGKIGKINNLRLGESILLGREPLQRKAILGLFTDATKLVAEVIESKIKPSKAWGTIAQSAFKGARNSVGSGNINQAILAIGRQDTDPEGLQAPKGVIVLDASSDHTILDTGKNKLRVGEEVSFQLNYSALLSAMTSPYVSKNFTGSSAILRPNPDLHFLPAAA
ncbi:alanine/ornithine racemase family PLP-dependent enzyme [Ahrensia kielensis]|uniref:Alanine/ornithine racemase family PLP-dependent enzyme n=1 Tax=Ahrensia kielensis TaxID=76980 RepID=A0ABU9T2B7_9HYPH